MTVYVDDVQHSFGRMKMCHLWADTLDELLDMVKKIGVDVKWIQGHPELSFGKHREASWIHFDIALSKKALALREGAILTDKYGPIVHTTMLRKAQAIKEGNVSQVMICDDTINRIERARALAKLGRVQAEMELG